MFELLGGVDPVMGVGVIVDVVVMWCCGFGSGLDLGLWALWVWI